MIRIYHVHGEAAVRIRVKRGGEYAELSRNVDSPDEAEAIAERMRDYVNVAPSLEALFSRARREYREAKERMEAEAQTHATASPVSVNVVEDIG